MSSNHSRRARDAPRDRWGTLTGLLTPLLALLVAAVSVLGVAVPSADRQGEASGGDFSVQRSQDDLEHIATAPRPSGSPENERVRGFITDRLEELDLRTRTHRSSTALPGAESSHIVGWTENVVATLEGEQPTGRVILVAHYDSVSVSPGAADNGMNVSVLLELARVLSRGPAPRNDVVFLFTDSEEYGLLGARAFLDEDEAGPEDDIVLNLDARGTGGGVVMFETGEDDAAYVGALGTDPPFTTSLASEVYARLPNETDFTVLRDAGFAGMNFAVMEGASRYHSEQDDLDHMDAGSQREMGGIVLGAVRELAETDLTQTAGAGEAVYFTVLDRVIRYPAALTTPFALLALASAGLALYACRARLNTRSALRCFLALPLVPAAAALSGWAVWRGVLLLLPHLESSVLGEPHAVVAPRIGLMLIALVVTLLAATWLRRRSGTPEVLAAAVLWLSLLTVFSALLLPGAAYLFTWSAVMAAAGLVALCRFPGESPWARVAVCAAALPTVLLYAPLIWLLFVSLGLAWSSVPLALLALLTVVAWPGWELSPRRYARPRRVALALAVVAALIAVGAANGAPSPGAPTQAGLVYALDADEERAHWVVEDTRTDPWAAEYVEDTAAGLEERFPGLLVEEGARRGPAPLLEVPEPTLRVQAEDPAAGAVRRVRVRVSAESGTPTRIVLYADTDSADLVGAEVGTHTLAGGVNRPFTDTEWGWGLILSGPPAEGIELTLVLRGPEPVRVLLEAQSGAVPLEALDPERPATSIWGGASFEPTFASRVYQL